MRKLAATLVVLELLVAGGVLGVRRIRHDATHVDGASAPATTATTGVVVVPAAGQTLVSGTVTSLTGDSVAPSAPLRLPLTIDAENRGDTQAQFEQVIYQGQRATVEWDGGRPLPLTGTGGIDLFDSGGANVTVDATGATWLLDGATRTLLPGSYTTGFTVGVGSSGLATFHDEPITFQADSHSILNTQAGGAVHEPAAAMHLEGPGSLTLTGALTLRTAQGTRTAASLRFGPGPFTLDLTPTAGGYAISATLQGATTLG